MSHLYRDKSMPFRQIMTRVCLSLLAFAATPALEAQESPKHDPQELASRVKQLFRNRCVQCHDDKTKASDINILDLTTLIDEAEAVVRGDAGESSLFDRITDDDEDLRMPPGPAPALEQTEIELVRRWIEADAPDFPEDVVLPDEASTDPALAGVAGAEYVFKQILDYIEKTPRDDRPYLRFFSSNHLVTDGVTREELKLNQQALTKAINHLSMQSSIVKPTVVDEEAGTVFAVDIRRLGWHQQPFTVMQNGRATKRSRANLHDLILLEYPYGTVFEGSETFDQLWDIYLRPAGMMRPIPFMRIDWFVSTATQFPLYEDLMQLPHDLADLEQRIGVDTELNLQSYVAKRAGMTISQVSRNNRVVEHHPARYGSYWKSFDFETSKGLQNMFIDPVNFHFAGGEMIFTLPNGLQGYLITDNAGNRIQDAPTTIVTDKFSADKVVRNGLACMRCHKEGMIRFEDKMRVPIESLPPTALPNRRDILRLYPKKEAMDERLDEQEQQFMAAMERALGEPQKAEPLTDVTRNYLDNALSLDQAAAELGLESSDGLARVFALPQFTRLGLAGLTAGGAIRRDSWEDYFDLITGHLGLGLPIAPVDGLTRPDHLADGRSFGLILKTNKRNNIFSPGDKMFISVENNSGIDLFIELIGTDARGKAVELTNGVIPLRSAAAWRFPDNGSIKIEPQLGKETITVFASPNQFAAGELLRGQHIADRFVHSFYGYERHDGHGRLTRNPSGLIKKTLKIETK